MSTTETPADKTMRRFYEGSLAERLMQAASMERNRQLLRRGARKMQDGLLGQPEAVSGEDDEVNIHIGDIHTSSTSPAEHKQAGWVDFAKKSALAIALLSGGGALGYALTAAVQPEQPVVQPSTDTWIEYDGQKFVPGK